MNDRTYGPTLRPSGEWLAQEFHILTDLLGVSKQDACKSLGLARDRYGDPIFC